MRIKDRIKNWLKMRFVTTKGPIKARIRAVLMVVLLVFAFPFFLPSSPFKHFGDFFFRYPQSLDVAARIMIISKDEASAARAEIAKYKTADDLRSAMTLTLKRLGKKQYQDAQNALPQRKHPALLKVYFWSLFLLVSATLFAACALINDLKNLLFLGHAAWTRKTHGKRDKGLKALNLIYYFAYFPLMLYHGFASRLNNLPKVHGSPGRFALRMAVTRAVISAALFAGAYRAAMMSKGLEPAWQAGFLGLAACLALPAFVALRWAGLAYKGYRAERTVSVALTEFVLSTGATSEHCEIFWGEKYDYRSGRSSGSPDFASRVGEFFRGIFKKDSTNKADIDLIIDFKAARGAAAVEIKSYPAWYDGKTQWQTKENAKKVEASFTGLVLPVVICPSENQDFAVFFVKGGEKLSVSTDQMNSSKKAEQWVSTAGGEPWLVELFGFNMLHAGAGIACIMNILWSNAEKYAQYQDAVTDSIDPIKSRGEDTSAGLEDWLSNSPQ